MTDWNNNSPSTRWDHLWFSIVDNLDLSLVDPSVVKSLVWDNYVTKTEEILPNWKKQVKETVNVAELEKIKKDFVYKHITTMKNHFRENYNDLTDFFKNIRSVDDISISMTTALYANKEDVIEWIKAKIFLPESYGVVYSWNQWEWTDNSGNWNAWVEVATAWAAWAALLDLTSSEKSEMQNLVEQSKTPNNINYLENPTYKKYLNVIERDLKLPKHALECVCKQESQWKLYNWKNIIWSRAWAQWLFQFMPGTADSYMKNSQLWEKYWKTFKSRDEFLKDPLATAWAAWIMYSWFLSKGYSFQSSLACYNRWEWHYKGKFKDKKALTAWDLEKLPNETKKYVENITKDVLAHNSASSSDILADLSKYSWNESATPNGDIESQRNKELFIWPSLLAQNEKQLWWLWNSIMNWIQWLDKKTNFPNMNWIVWKNTKNHPDMLRSKEDVAAYKKANPDVKSFMLYFWENNSNYDETLKDITKLAELLHAEWIQPVLCTCIWEDKHSRIPSLNSGILALWQQKQYPIFNFDKAYKDWDIKIWSDGVHPTSYAPMTDIIKSQINQA